MPGNTHSQRPVPGHRRGGRPFVGGDLEQHVIHVEGVTAFNKLRKPTGNTGCNNAGLKTATVWADVSDGKLTIDAIGGTNTKLDFVTIDTVRSPA